MREGADGAVVTDGDIAVNDCEWSNDSIASDRNSEIDMSLRGVFNGDAGQHQLCLNLLLNAGRDFRQLNTSVHSQSFLNRQATGRRYVMALIHQDSRTIRQIVFGLTVIRLNTLQC